MLENKHILLLRGVACTSKNLMVMTAIVLLVVVLCAARGACSETDNAPRAFVGLDGEDNVLLESANDVRVRGRRLLLNGHDLQAGAACPEVQRLELRAPTRT